MIGYKHFVTIPSTQIIFPRKIEVTERGVKCLLPKLWIRRYYYHRQRITIDHFNLILGVKENLPSSPMKNSSNCLLKPGSEIATNSFRALWKATCSSKQLWVSLSRFIDYIRESSCTLRRKLTRWLSSSCAYANRWCSPPIYRTLHLSSRGLSVGKLLGFPNERKSRKWNAVLANEMHLEINNK